VSEKHTARRAEKEAHRAAIIRLLVPVYPQGLTFSGLQQALMIEGRSLTSEEINFQLAYLEEGGYVKLERETRRRKTIVLGAAATRKAVDLLDGRIAEDPGIAL